MTKKDQKLINEFLMGMLKSKNRRLVNAKIFDKRRQGQLVVLPVKDIIKHWKKFREVVENI